MPFSPKTHTRFRRLSIRQNQSIFLRRHQRKSVKICRKPEKIHKMFKKFLHLCKTLALHLAKNVKNIIARFWSIFIKKIKIFRRIYNTKYSPLPVIFHRIVQYLCIAEIFNANNFIKSRYKLK